MYRIALMVLNLLKTQVFGFFSGLIEKPDKIKTSDFKVELVTRQMGFVLKIVQIAVL